MGRARTFTRRAFLIGSAAIAGGVAFGAYVVRRDAENPLLADLGEGEAAITPYVKITADGITLITPRADSGQGVYSAQAMLIAEELDVELDQVSVDPGPPSAAYWNTAFGEEASEFMVPAGGIGQAMASGAVNAVAKVLGLQMTGGSTSMPDSFDKLRQAGAVARETLKAAAAEVHDVAAADLRTEKGAVILPDGTAVPYTDLASAAAGIIPVQDVALRAPDQWRLIGKDVQRIDILPKSTGTLTYGIDRVVPDMVHATIVLNPAQGGTLKGFDATEALAMRGVQDVIEITGGVAVIADNTWRAMQAAQAISFDWGPATMPATMDEHWATLDAAFTEDALDSRLRDDGDVTVALDGAEVIEAEFRAPYLAHAPLEPISAIVKVTDDGVEVWTGTQIPRFIQVNVGRITGFAPEQVIVHAEYMGGSFGHRLEDEVVKQATEVAMALKGTPVKLTYSREEDMTHDFVRQIAKARLRGTVKDGKVEAMDLSIAMPSVIASQMQRQGQNVPGPDSQIVAGAFEQPFAIPHQRVSGYRAAPLAPLSSWRSVGASTNGFFYNAALEELIHAAGADPLEERLRLCSDPLARAVLEAVAEMSDWSGPQGADGTGRGVALTRSFGVPTAEVVAVRQTDRGLKVENVWIVAEVGQVVDPVNIENHLIGGVIWGLGHAMNCEITYENGIAQQTNYHAFEGMRMYQSPVVEARALENGDHVKGIGEPPVPPAAPALANAIFAATGTRLRAMPFNAFVDFA